jgi:serine/threonine protein phosphatase PrpC
VRIECADLSLIGDREDNQDRVAIVTHAAGALLVVIDGMGGHSDGALAADTALHSLRDSFQHDALPLLDPIGFLHRSLSRAHDQVASLGRGLRLDARPRATIAVALVQQASAYWGHIGDSRVYHLRQGGMLVRTRDHSHVEMLLREGKITEGELATHPMRNFVECCLGGDPAIPEMTLSGRHGLQPGDVVLLCTDGVWAGTRDAEMAACSVIPGQPLAAAMSALAARAVHANAPFSDNASIAALRWLGD